MKVELSQCYDRVTMQTSNVTSLESYRNPWKETFVLDNESTTLQAYVNVRTCELEIVQQNHDGNTIRSTFSRNDLLELIHALSSTLNNQTNFIKNHT